MLTTTDAYILTPNDAQHEARAIGLDAEESSCRSPQPGRADSEPGPGEGLSDLRCNWSDTPSAARGKSNEHLADRGNAALTLQLLGGHHTLDWYLPVPPPAAPGQQRPLLSLVPPGWIWGTVMLLIAGIVTALWRARRLGPLVVEPLPVVVRADETVRGRARLYRRAGARDRAAAVLRADARRDLAGRLGVPAEVGVPADVGALADADVADLLAGRAPADDHALVALAAAVDLLVREVHAS